MIRDMEDERIQLRRELSNCRDQIHQLHESHRHCVTLSQSPNTHSRPSSFVSVASTASDGIADFFEHQQLLSGIDLILSFKLIFFLINKCILTLS